MLGTGDLCGLWGLWTGERLEAGGALLDAGDGDWRREREESARRRGGGQSGSIRALGVGRPSGSIDS
ncbi:hypothetical protein ACHAWF_012358 [Thalassiosira exigua]